MADILDPRQIEEQSQAEQENYKVYKRRWLVLFATFSVILVVGLHRCIISIENILCDYVGMTNEGYEIVLQISMYTILLSVLAMARAIDYFGLRRILYLACTFILFANGLKALCCCDEKYVTVWVKDHRYYILILSELFVGLAQSICLCIPAKVSSVWFANYESTLALVIANCGFNIGIGFSNYFTPVFVKSTDDMYKLSYLFIISGFLVTFIVLTCVTRSSPKMPPSSSAIMSASTLVPLRSGIAVMISDPNYILLLFTLSILGSSLGVTQFVLEDILQSNHYTNSFCGTLIAHAYFFGTFFMLMGAAWVDNSANYVKVSRIASIICAIGIATFNISIILPNIKSVILVTNVMASFGCSLMYPALFQVCLRSATTILPEATVSAIIIILQQIISGLLMNSFTPLKKLSPEPGGYQAPMLIFSCVVMIISMLYSSSFKAPSRDELQERLRNWGAPTIMENEIDP
uniref:Feline leukemia virus subgroup C receptor-related protein 2 n=1 Tax=Aceria tosichella TaxID=561515 RepID=A0A6G1SHE0_9ACAR